MTPPLSTRSLEVLTVTRPGISSVERRDGDERGDTYDGIEASDFNGVRNIEDRIARIANTQRNTGDIRSVE